MAVPLPVQKDGKVQYYRLNLPIVSETLQIHSGRRIELLASHDIPATLDLPGDTVDVTLALHATAGEATVGGKASIVRSGTLYSNNDPIASLSFTYELDMMGLASERPHVRVPNAKLVGISQTRGLLEGATLAREGTLASPVAQLKLTVPNTSVAFSKGEQQLTGTVVLMQLVTPEALRDRSSGMVVLRMFDGAKSIRIARSVIVSAEEGKETWRSADSTVSIEWTKNQKTWHGLLVAQLPGGAQAQRASLVLGDQASAFPIHSAGFVDTTGAQASLDSNSNTASLRP